LPSQPANPRLQPPPRPAPSPTPPTTPGPCSGLTPAVLRAQVRGTGARLQALEEAVAAQNK